MGDSKASLIYGAYTGLVYAAPILGGRMADKYLGYRYAVMLGAVLMAIGEFLILGNNENMMLIGMGALIIGNGYFKRKRDLSHLEKMKSLKTGWKSRLFGHHDHRA